MSATTENTELPLEEQLEEIEVEVTDDENEEDGDEDGDVDLVSDNGAPEEGQLNPPQAGTSAAVTPATSSTVHSSAAPTKKPSPIGKVQPSKEVQSLRHKAPVPSSSSLLNPEKNPFPSIGTWSKQDINSITIQFPVLTGKNESTNDLTRASRPEARYWKAPISFKYGQWTSTTIRFENVPIPFHSSSGYGTNFIYMCLPGHVSDAFAAAGKVVAPTRTTETSLVPDPERWWKIANNVEGKVGVIDKSTKKFYPKSLSTIFDSSQAGVIATVILSFTVKASTMEKENLKPTTVRTLSVDLIRGYIDKVGENIQIPTRVTKSKAQVQPAATSKDVASDDLMKRLADMGL